jgi:hypothetical protein
MAAAVAETFGRLLAKTLAGAWRCTPPKVDFSELELVRIGPHLLRSGAAPLSWWRVRHSSLHTSEVANSFRQAYRLNTLQTLIKDAKIQKIFPLLRSAGVEPILIKGWAVSTYYPERGLRPYGDFDLCVQPGQYRAATSALANIDRSQYNIDLHRGFEKFGNEGFNELYCRSLLIRLGEVEVRVLSREDHFRLICFHLLREGAWRPLWLCDIAAMLETTPADFDWKVCLGTNRQARSVACAISLAHLLLGAVIECVPDTAQLKKIPRWLVPTVLKEWGSLFPTMRLRHGTTMLMHLRETRNLLQGVRARWPNPIEATVSMNGPFNELPRLPFQLGNCLSRSIAFLAHLPGRIRHPSSSIARQRQ